MASRQLFFRRHWRRPAPRCRRVSPRSPHGSCENAARLRRRMRETVIRLRKVSSLSPCGRGWRGSKTRAGGGYSPCPSDWRGYLQARMTASAERHCSNSADSESTSSQRCILFCRDQIKRVGPPSISMTRCVEADKIENVTLERSLSAELEIRNADDAGAATWQLLHLLARAAFVSQSCGWFAQSDDDSALVSANPSPAFASLRHPLPQGAREKM